MSRKKRKQPNITRKPVSPTNRGAGKPTGNTSGTLSEDPEELTFGDAAHVSERFRNRNRKAEEKARAKAEEQAREEAERERHEREQARLEVERREREDERRHVIEEESLDDFAEDTDGGATSDGGRTASRGAAPAVTRPERDRTAETIALNLDGLHGLGTTGLAAAPKRKRIWLRALIGLLVAALVAGSGAGGWWMWENRWRPIDVTVNGTTVRANVHTTLAQLIARNDSFGKKPGRLLAVDGSVLDKTGGRAVAAAIGGQAIAPRDRDAVIVPEHADITVASGKDVTEAHTVKKTTVPFGTNINIKGGAIQVRTQAGKDGERETWTGKRSGKTADKGVTVKPVDMVVTSYNPRPEGKKVIALTFDDGPSQYSAPMLDILKDKGVKATFFDLGQQSSEFADAEKRMVAEGHQVASHSFDHPNMPKLSRDALRDNITKGFTAMKQTSGVDTTVFRSPYGAFGDQQWKDAGDLIGMNVLWTIDTEDWKRPGADAIHDAVLNNAYDGAIVLMHDGGGDRTQDIEALPRIIDDLKGQGYEFVTIQQLIDMSPKPGE
ncbi:polysaccharide deacetylase family protein [Bifidobacterium sp. CP2]|uniref:polysaccharide deacetylase family protein n=1 Tax=Bifidobacterium sp. CP2 TaxID=2809025 RepID=UPI001F0A77F1|nr:polysaccharide deacetylase family protein [Bifidobacterium sp. CP2]